MTTKNKIVTIRLTSKHRAMLAELAQDNEIPVSRMVATLVEFAYKRKVIAEKILEKMQ